MDRWPLALGLALALTVGPSGWVSVSRAQMGHEGMPMGPSGPPAARLDLATDPAPPQPRLPTTLTLTVRDAASGAPLTDLQPEHQRLLHLIVVSDDLALFSHVHPDSLGPGQFRIAYTFPSAGPYHLFADFVSAALGAQQASASLEVAGPAPAPAPLAPEGTTCACNGAQVSLQVDPNPPRVGQPARLTFRLSQAGQPLDTLAPYLGVAGHLVAISQDLQEYLHAHPGGQPMEHGAGHMAMPMASPTARFGPEVTFTVTFQRAGPHKVWGQFSLDGDVITAPFVVQVAG